MKTSPLLAGMTSAGTPGEYHGATSASRLVGATLPDDAPRLYDTAWRSMLAVHGADARKWLNGMVTANVRDLRVGQVVPSFQLDPKGHILATFDLACVGENEFLLLSDELQRAGLEDRLRKFVFISKLTLEDRSQRFGSLLLQGAGWRAAWEQAQLPPAPLAAGECVPVADPAGGGLVVRTAPGGREQVELWALPAALAAAWERLARVAVACGWEEYERQRIINGEPSFGSDIAGTELPQETGQSDRLDFTKGCYVGQEIVERVRARGAVHRHLARFVFEQAVHPGDELCVAGAPVGRLTSVTRSDGGEVLALGYIRDPHFQAGAAVMAGGTAGKVVA